MKQWYEERHFSYHPLVRQSGHTKKTPTSVSLEDQALSCFLKRRILSDRETMIRDRKDILHTIFCCINVGMRAHRKHRLRSLYFFPRAVVRDTTRRSNDLRSRLRINGDRILVHETDTCKNQICNRFSNIENHKLFF